MFCIKYITRKYDDSEMIMISFNTNDDDWSIDNDEIEMMMVTTTTTAKKNWWWWCNMSGVVMIVVIRRLWFWRRLW